MSIGLVTGPLIARAVGPAGRGEIATATIYALIATSVASLGLPIAFSHAVANGTHPLGAILSTTVRVAFILAVPLSLFGLVVVVGPLRNMSTAGRLGAAGLIAAVPLAVLSNCLSLILIGEGKLRGLVWIQVLPVVLVAVATVGAFAVNVLSVGSYLSITLLATILGLVLAWRSVGTKPTRSLPIAPFVRFGVRGYAGYLAAFGSVRFDQAVIGPILGSESLGLYAVATTLSLLPFTLARAVASRSFGTVARTSQADLVETASTYLRLTLLTATIVVAGIAAFSPFLVPLLYGSAFTGAVPALLILLPGTVALCGSATASSCLASIGRPGQTTIAELIGFVITVVGLPLVVPTLGINGAAALSTATYASTFFAYRLFLRRLGPVRSWPKMSDISYLFVALYRSGVATGIRVGGVLAERASGNAEVSDSTVVGSSEG